MHIALWWTWDESFWAIALQKNSVVQVYQKAFLWSFVTCFIWTLLMSVASRSAIDSFYRRRLTWELLFHLFNFPGTVAYFAFRQAYRGSRKVHFLVTWCINFMVKITKNTFRSFSSLLAVHFYRIQTNPFNILLTHIALKPIQSWNSVCQSL